MKYKSIDILRGIAILMVILAHSVQRFGELSKFFRYFSFGQMGCQVFFTISGFCCAISYVNSIRRHPNGGGISEFYKKRYLSLAPSYYVMILVTFILNTLTLAIWNRTIGFAENRNPLAILCNLLFIHGLLPFCNNNVMSGAWYVGTAMVLYLFSPLLFYCATHFIVKPFRLLIWAIMVISLSLVTAILYFDLLPSDFTYFSFLTQLPCFCFGLLLYLQIFETGGGRGEKIPLRSAIWLAGGIVVFALAFALYYVDKPDNISILGILIRKIPPEFYLSSVIGVSTYCLMKGMLGLEIRWRKRFQGRVARLFEFLGKNSLGIYLTHCLFVWTMPLAILAILRNLGIHINHNVLYLALLPFMIAFSLIAGLLLGRLVKIIEPYFRRVVGG